MDPQWDDMKVFLAVAREASLSGAGRILKMDPATVGRRIARFEAALETPLFVKSPQGYALSAAGDRLLVHAEAAEQAMRAGTEALERPQRHYVRADPHRRAGRQRQLHSAAGLRPDRRSKPGSGHPDRGAAPGDQPEPPRGGYGGYRQRSPPRASCWCRRSATISCTWSRRATI